MAETCVETVKTLPQKEQESTKVSSRKDSPCHLGKSLLLPRHGSSPVKQGAALPGLSCCPVHILRFSGDCKHASYCLPAPIKNLIEKSFPRVLLLFVL